MNTILELKKVIYDPFARNGTWCTYPYSNHPKGCPNFPRCPNKNPDFKTLPTYKWYAVIEEFDLYAHAVRMKIAHPGWSERQCRNPLYWQGSVRKKLREAATSFLNDQEGIILKDPEACGVEVFETMALVGVILSRTPGIVRKIVLVGVV